MGQMMLRFKEKKAQKGQRSAKTSQTERARVYIAKG